jgi:tetratricopeptide (TPR) repeat protein
MISVVGAVVVMESSAKASHLLTPIYLAALAGLLLNDHVLKAAAPGLITGKLSDFCGLFALAVFLSVLSPRLTIAWHIGLAVAFVAWKSPAADVVIHAWNATMPFRIARVVDYWDLTALSVLPLSFFYLRRDWPALRLTTEWLKATGKVAVALVSLFAFAATSRLPDRSHIHAGEAFTRDGEYDRAIREFDIALKIAPDSAEILYLRGTAKLKHGDTVGGQTDMAAAVAIDPKYRQLASEWCFANC